MGPFLRTLRQAAGLTIDDVVTALSVARGTVYAWEAGDKEPEKANLSRLADLYKVSKEDRLRLASMRAYGVDTDVTEAAPS